MNAPAPVRILAVDGGGIRGIVPAVMLIELQQRLSRPLVECFDVVAGTSTGGMIAAAVCAADHSGAPRYTPEQILEFYLRDCHQIFHRSLGWTLRSLGGLRRPKYPASGIEAFLAARFGELPLSAALKPLVLVSYDLQRRTPWLFRSTAARADAAQDFRVRDACRASTAAPTYFPSATVTSFAGTGHEMVDGGVCANDPALAAFVEADQAFSARPVMVVSLGTGDITSPIDGRAARRAGVLGWATHLIDLLADGQSGIAELSLGNLIGISASAGSRYWRLQPELAPGMGQMDDLSAEHLAGLQRVTRDYCRSHAALFEEIARTLES